MPKLRVHSVALSVDGYGAGPNQDLDNPLGVGGLGLHEWVFPTRTFRRMNGMEGGDKGLDDHFATQGDTVIGATILGRKLFGPLQPPQSYSNVSAFCAATPPIHPPLFQ